MILIALFLPRTAPCKLFRHRVRVLCNLSLRTWLPLSNASISHVDRRSTGCAARFVIPAGAERQPRLPFASAAAGNVFGAPLRDSCPVRATCVDRTGGWISCNLPQHRRHADASLDGRCISSKQSRGWVARDIVAAKQ